MAKKRRSCREGRTDPPPAGRAAARGRSSICARRHVRGGRAPQASQEVRRRAPRRDRPCGQGRRQTPLRDPRRRNGSEPPGSCRTAALRTGRQPRCAQGLRLRTTRLRARGSKSGCARRTEPRLRRRPRDRRARSRARPGARQTALRMRPRGLQVSYGVRTYV